LFNVDNINNVRHESSRHLRNKKKEYLKAVMEELEVDSKIKKILGICIGESVALRTVTSLELVQ